jgi:hypothetical protein
VKASKLLLRYLKLSRLLGYRESILLKTSDYVGCVNLFSSDNNDAVACDSRFCSFLLLFSTTSMSVEDSQEVFPYVICFGKSEKFDL